MHRRSLGSIVGCAVSALFGVALTLAAPGVAHASGAPATTQKAKPKTKAKVELAAIEWKDGEKVSKERARQVKSAVRRAAQSAQKHLDFGQHGRLELTIVIKELSFEESDGLLRVSCTLVGRLKGGGSARSRISFGGKPSDKKKMERQVLASVTEGVMIRLAEMARAADAERAKVIEEERSKRKDS